MLHTSLGMPADGLCRIKTAGQGRVSDAREQAYERDVRNQTARKPASLCVLSMWTYDPLYESSM